MQYERKIIYIFKSFIEKALIPQIRKMQGSLFQWNKFNSMISTQNINYSQLQAFVESLPSIPSLQSPQRKEQFSYFKKRTNQLNDHQNQSQQQQSQSFGFNPSKTFGGSRAKMMFPLQKDIDDFEYKKEQLSSNNLRDSNRSQEYKKINPQTMLPGLERLVKIFGENQGKMQKQMDLPTHTTHGIERQKSY